jgi:16S rRNA (cytosine967-C5)-methyltransferase
MFDSATFNHAARVLAEVAADFPADAALRRYLGLARRLGPREKRAVSRAVFTYFRWLQWLDAKQSVQKRLERAAELQARFDRDPRSVKVEALTARAVPAWLRDEMELPAEYLQQLQREPALWLRARPGTAAALARRLGDCVAAGAVPGVSSSEFGVRGSPAEPVVHASASAATPAASKPETPNPKLQTSASAAPRAASAPDALRYTGTQDLFVTPAFHEGTFEIQDLASQLVSILAAPQPRQTWWDACAGEGGKLLHLADLMDNKGLIWASDRSARRLENLKRRAARAHIFNFRTAGWDGGPRLPTKTRFDGILVDAPCSGIGTWQRNPHARWTTTLEDVRELAAVQRSLLEHVGSALKPGGRLIYSVCTLTRSETVAVADAFTAAHPEFAPLPLPGGAPQVTLWPHELNANGMFVAAWQRK